MGVALPPHPKTLGKGPSAILQDARAQDEADRLDRHRSEDINDACAKIEEEVEGLKARYEMYFLGLERREPVRDRNELKRQVAKLKGEFVRNTGLRFRIQTLHARFLSYERMWQRSAREKEEGTYRRDVLKARRRVRGEPPAAKAEPAAAPATAPALRRVRGGEAALPGGHLALLIRGAGAQRREAGPGAPGQVQGEVGRLQGRGPRRARGAESAAPPLIEGLAPA